MILDRLSPEQWAQLAPLAEGYSFGSVDPSGFARLDFALIGIEHSVIVGWATFREKTATSVFWQFGGAAPNAEKSLHVLRFYGGVMEHLAKTYQDVSTLIKNDNAPMLKLAAKIGYKIVGLRAVKGDILLEHALNLGERLNVADCR